ncbi:hypothetical protein K2173_015115 [Erythroxylum novogranatense]|uniref:Uncharacterized protein n=1 Tax=Erythroxylum novogranatense TaxID=1862640 RepID=A0AAV8T2L1_9ROSI|nr:hypothetical protein K2173_015115 [Erythroxylum novogranatense]
MKTKAREKEQESEREKNKKITSNNYVVWIQNKRRFFLSFGVLDLILGYVGCRFPVAGDLYTLCLPQFGRFFSCN